MANLILKGETQIQAEILAELIVLLGLNDVNAGSVIDVITQAVAQQDFALYYQLAQVSRLVDLNALTGTDLDNKAFEYGLTRIAAQKAKGNITVFRPAGFVKVATNFYAGSPAPISGNTVIDVNDASNVLIGSSGTLILGRNTNNEEEVSYSVAPISHITFWRYTLTTPLTKDHAVEETVILKQGVDEIIPAGTVVIVPPTGVSAEIDFTVDNDNVLLAGEAEVDNVEITAVVAGSSGNIGVAAINGTNAFSNPPFVGARATNQITFTSGVDLESDDHLRDRIKAFIPANSKAIKQAILNAIVGLVDPETAKRVVSASVILPLLVADAVKIYIDDGTGFEPSFDSVGFEEIINSATGGEETLQTQKFPVVKAQLETNSSSPYDMQGSPLTLIYEVGNVSETISFQLSDFINPAIATANEIVSAINGRSNLLEARTAEVGTKVLITAKADINENIQVTGGTSNAILNFPPDRKDTINLYKNDVLLSKDGLTAELDSGNIAPYDLLAVGAYPHTLTLVIDGKTANSQTTSVGLFDVQDPSAATAKEISDVINRDIAGVLAFPIDNNTRVRITSLTLLSSKSKLHITGGSLNNAINGLNMTTAEVVGIDHDYSFNRELGIIELATPAVDNDNFTLGSLFTRAKLRAANAELYSPANGSTLNISVDGGGTQTITFDATFATPKTASQTAFFINVQLRGAVAIVRQIGGFNYLEINTNSYENGSLEIFSSSTANSAFQFPTDTLVVNSIPDKAFVVSGNTGPFDFAEGDSLVIVVDDDIVNNTFNILFNYPGTVTTPTSTTVFADSNLSSVFQDQNVINNFYVAFTSGLNTASGVIDTVAVLGGGVARYTFNPVPGTFASYAVGDLFSVSGLDNSENNGHFVISAILTDHVDVTNLAAVAASAQSGTGILSERRQVSAYNQLSGQVTVSAPFSNAPASTDPFIVIPSTIDNLVYFIGNIKINSYTIKGTVEGTDNNTRIQLSSNQQGSDGSIEVTGGKANDKLDFSTVIFNGIAAYSNWTGLIKLVHSTIYGLDTDLVTFPGIGAAGITFRIQAPTVRQLIIALQVVLDPGVTITSLENEIKSAVSGYVNTLGVGGDVILERIRAAVIAIPGISDVTITGPLANVAIADNERADVKDPNILIG